LIFSVDALETIKDKKLIEKHKKEHFVERYFRAKELKTILGEIGFREINIYPIFRSIFANRLFIEGINNNFQYGYSYLRLILTFFFLDIKNIVVSERMRVYFSSQNVSNKYQLFYLCEVF
jgi:hypothetical protein